MEKMKKIKLRKIRILHSKKAQYFMPLFAFFVLVLFTLIYFDLAAKTEQFESCEGESNKIGEKQLAVLNAVAEGEKALLYLDLSAQQAYGAAVLETAKTNYLDSSSCSFYRGVPVVYGNSDCMKYGDELEEEVGNALSDAFDVALIPYLEAYEDILPLPFEYLLTFDEDRLLGFSPAPLEIPIMSITSTPLQEGSSTAASISSKAFTQWPVAYDEHRVNSCFGYRGGDVVSGTSKGTTYHAGVDIRGYLGTNVLAVAAGTVIDTSPVRWGRVVLDHGDGLYTIYLHMDTIAVAVGDTVAQGAILGTTGGRGKNSASAYDPHLHFEVIDTTVPSDLTDAQGEKATLSSSWTKKSVNPLCYFASSVTYDYNNNLACRSQGGLYKFCDLYNQQTGVSVSISTSGISYTPSASTKEKLKQIDANYGKLIESSISGTSVPKALVVAVIKTESDGNPYAVSSTKACGLMQFTYTTGEGYGLDATICEKKCGCSTSCTKEQAERDCGCDLNDERFDPEKTIPAGVKLLQANMKSFDNYKDKVAFSLAAYNGGAGLIKKAIAATGKNDPSWEEVSLQITEDLIAQVYSDAFSSSVYKESFGTTEKRNRKVKEVRRYANRVLSYYYAYESLEN